MGLSHRRTVGLAAIVLGLVLASCGESEAGDQVGSNAAPSSSSSSTPESAEAVEIATRFLGARDDLDFEATRALLSADAIILDFGFQPRTPDGYEVLFEWMEIFEWRSLPDGCEEISSQPPLRVKCSYRTENVWSRTEGADPVPGTLDLIIEDGSIVEVISDRGSGWGEVFDSWASWLDRFHPSDFRVLYPPPEPGEKPIGPAMTPEALELFRVRSTEYVEWHAAQDE